ncbi:hypothetical protein QVD99_000392 [Batrachochytrium dendrobatidis]|nr:hypothetical protein O5D80_007967 [Batrachochytrium dendrobatidis]KAK5672907.1 hypothetical protein QVD99_000392 [Batrachochytrium dendrobatidis]
MFLPHNKKHRPRDPKLLKLIQDREAVVHKLESLEHSRVAVCSNSNEILMQDLDHDSPEISNNSLESKVSIINLESAPEASKHSASTITTKSVQDIKKIDLDKANISDNTSSDQIVNNKLSSPTAPVITAKYDTVLKMQGNDSLSDIRQFRAEYLKSGGYDGRVLADRSEMEKNAFNFDQNHYAYNDRMNSRFNGGIVDSTIPQNSDELLFLENQPNKYGFNETTFKKNRSFSPEDIELESLKRQHRLRVTKLTQQQELLRLQNDLRNLKRDIGDIDDSDITYETPKETAVDYKGKTIAQNEQPHFCANKLNTISNSSIGPVPADLPQSIFYEPVRGFNILWDFMILDDSFGNWTHAQITFSVFEGERAIRPVEIIPFRPCLPLYPTENGLKTRWCAPLKLETHVHGIEPVPFMRLVVEVRVKNQADPSECSRMNPVCIGWTSFSIFSDRMLLDSGRWKLPLFPPPIDFNMTNEHLHHVKQPLSETAIFIRVCDNAHLLLFSKEVAIPSFEKYYKTKTYSPASQTHYKKSTKFYAESVNADQDCDIKPTALGVTKSIRELLCHYLQVVPYDSLAINQTLETQGPIVQDDQNLIKDINQQLAVAPLFDLGIQIEELFLDGMPDIVSVAIKMHIVDSYHQPQTHIGFQSQLAERSAESNRTFVWQHGLHHEFKNVAAISERVAIFEVIQENEATFAYTELKLFKFQKNKVFGINDGLHVLELRFVKKPDTNLCKSSVNNNGELKNQILVRIYNPKHGTPPHKKCVSMISKSSIPCDSWISVPWKPDQPYNREMFTIVIDGARFLPPNTTATQVFAKIYNSKFQPIKRCTEMITPIHLDSPACFPIYDFSQCFEGSNYDPTAMIVFQIMTVDSSTRRKRLVGTAALNLFVDISTGEQPESRSTTDTVLMNHGAFQIPLYATALLHNTRLIMSKIQKLNRVPCASLLIRILFWKDNQKPQIKPLMYNQKQYFSDPFCKPTTYEEMQFEAVTNESRSFTIRDRLLSLPSISKVAKQGDDALNLWVTQFLAIDQSYEQIPMSYDYICQYDPSYGFQISIDGAFNLGVKGYTCCVVSLCPPANYYHTESCDENTSSDCIDAADSKFYDNIVFIKELDMSSFARQPIWKDGFHWYRGRTASQMYAIIHLFSVSLQNKSWTRQSQGWAVLPIFQKTVISMGCFQLPLFEHNPPRSFLNALTKSKDLANLLKLSQDQKDIRLTSKASSVVVRLCDSRRSDELQLDLKHAKPDFLGENPEKFLPSGTSPMISKLIPKNVSELEFVKAMRTALAEGEAKQFKSGWH